LFYSLQVLKSLDVRSWTYITKFQLSYSKITEIIREVCNVILRKLETSFELPTTEKEWEIISAGFERNANFPRCGGAIDISPADSGSLYYYNYYLLTHGAERFWRSRQFCSYSRIS
jgi:hypothetical protein